MKFPMLRPIVIFVMALLVCAFSLPDEKNTELAFGMSQADAGLVLGVSEEFEPTTLASEPALPEPITLAEPAAKAVAVAPTFVGDTQFELADCQGAVLDEETDTVLYGHKADEVVPIASITKLMTALVFLRNNPGWSVEYQLKTADRVEGGTIYLHTGNRVTVRDLFQTSLVGSANTATLALVRATGLSDSEFVRQMNEYAAELGLVKTKFFDPVGLSTGNLSTAGEVVKLAKVALADADIQKAVSLPVYEYTTLDGAKKTVRSTNSLLSSAQDGEVASRGGKTGFTNAAGYCFVGKFTNKDGQEVIAAILGGPSLNSRFTLARQLSEWTFGNYTW